MKKSILIILVTCISLGCVIEVYFHWQHNQSNPKAALVDASPLPVPPAAPKPEIRQVIEVPPTVVPLPDLSASDSFVLKGLTGLIANKASISLFHTEKIIHNITATIDNLTYRRVPRNVMPVDSVSGRFLTAESKGDLTINPMNAARYTPYVNIVELLDARKLVEFYVGLYPLFQQAYEELGYPKKYFNDRLIVVLDNLLAAPDIKEPIKLVQSTLFYQFADTDFEDRSIGQRILMRMGSINEQKIKSKLQSIKQELLLHMHEKIMGKVLERL